MIEEGGLVQRGILWVLRLGGLVMLVVGVAALALGPAEMVCFTWFSEGGRFHYEGFGFGSFMFGNLAMQIVGYYLMAAILIPLGYGHLRLRWWVPTVMRALVWAWVVLGLPLLAVLVFILFATKELSPVAGGGVAVLAALTYIVLPWLLLGFYRSECVTRAAARVSVEGRRRSGWVATAGVNGLLVVILQLFFVAALHLLLLFRGLFPILTGWITGMNGYLLVDGAILVLLALSWGTVRQRRWARWGTVAYLTGMLVLWVGTLAQTSWLDLLDILAFPPTEVDILDGMPLQGWHLAVLVALPLVGAVLVTAGTRIPEAT